MAIYKSQIQEAVEARKQEADELAKKFSTEAGKRVAVVSWKMSSRTYLVGIQFIGHLSPDLKVGDEYLYDGETMTIQYIVEAPKEAVEQTETEVTTEEWLALAEKTRQAWLSRKSDNHAEYKRCQAISHEAHDTWQRQLKLAVYS